MLFARTSGLEHIENRRPAFSNDQSYSTLTMHFGIHSHNIPSLIGSYGCTELPGRAWFLDMVIICEYYMLRDAPFVGLSQQ